MGSGDRISLSSSTTWGFGIYYDSFPFKYTFGFHVLKWHLTIGIGPGYDHNPIDFQS